MAGQSIFQNGTQRPLMDVREIRKMMMMRLGLLLLAEMLLVANRGPTIDGLVVKASDPRVLHLASRFCRARNSNRNRFSWPVRLLS
jgi:hypothetical protein